MIAAWAKDEMAGAELGDKRLNMRAQQVLSAMGNHPNLSIPAACGGRAEMEAAYRFFDNDKVTFDKVLQPHRTRTRQRIAAHPEVVLVQDTTELDLTRPELAVAGVGELDGSRRGFLLHEMQAFTPDGTPLGTVSAEVINRTGGVSHAPADQKRATNKQLPIEQKESFRWLTGLRQAGRLAQELPAVRFTCIADSEADIYEVFAEPRGTPAVDWLIRACQDRALQASGPDETARHLREQVSAARVLETVELAIRGRQAKTAAEDRARRQTREPRRATVEVRATAVTLRPPWRPDRTLPPVVVNVVWVREADPPAGEAPVEWLLLTTLPIATLKDVRRVVELYGVRWNIEVFFRTLKSGCRIEQRRFEDVERVLPCLAICLIVAWRTMFVCRLGRECPEADCEIVFEPSEWQAVWTAVYRKRLPRKPPKLAEMVHLIARLGGYIERAESDPGPQTIWIGLQRMYDLAWAWDAFGPNAKSPLR